ncbi:MAG TPA: CDP-alcohol phosphatidyltransferase family protein [Pseudonocardia sp.]|nr:CDP-alcohol phosphatidyltransferase family protein [Pseudonocardia sp.]
MTGHPPTHGRRAGTRTDGFRTGGHSPADSRSGDARTGDGHTGEPQRGDAHTGEPQRGEQGWAALHGGIRPSALVRLWLRGVQRLAAGPVARVSPDVLSVAGAAAAGGAAIVAAQGGRWPLAAATLVVLAGVLDGLDGAVALHTGRARPLGAVVDAMADRVGDLLLVATLAVLGAPPAWCIAAAATTLLHEYLRARAGAAGMPGVGALTVAERPTRLVLVAVACLGAGTLPGGTPLTGWGWATVCAIGWVAVAAVGFVHLSIGVARTTPRRFPDDDPPEDRHQR